MNDPRMKEQLALAREAGTRAMAKDFFAPTPGSGGPADGEMEAAPPDGGEAPGGEMPAEQPELTPEQIEELLALLAQQQTPQE